MSHQILVHVEALATQRTGVSEDAAVLEHVSTQAGRVGEFDATQVTRELAILGILVRLLHVLHELV